MNTANARLLTYAEVSALVRVPAATLRQWVRQGRLPHVRLGPRTVRFRPDQVESWLINGLPSGEVR